MFDASTRELHLTPAQKAELLTINVTAPGGLERWLEIMREAGHPLDGTVEVFCESG